VGEFVVVRAHLVYPLGGRAVVLGRPSQPVAGHLFTNARGLPERPKTVLEDSAGANVFCPELAAQLEDACLEAGAAFQRGVLAFAEGPCYETAAEARTLRWAGADVVSMSAAADAIVAHREGVRVGCLCCVTNSVGMWRGRAPTHEEVLAASNLARSRIGRIIENYVSFAVRGGKQ
jgi:purine nucleoside phosphorylase